MGLRGTAGGARPENDEEETSFAIHHMMPQHYGGLVVAEYVFIDPPPINAAAAAQPVNPGMPPLWHGSLPAPDAFRPFPPPLPGAVTAPPARPPAPSVQPSIPRPAPTPSTPAPAVPAPAAAPTTTAVSGEFVVEESSISLFVGPMLDAFDPLYALALFLAAELGSFVIAKPEVRYTVLWTILLAGGAVMTLVDSHRSRRGVSSGNLVWGVGIALVIGVLLLGFVGTGLRQASVLLLPYATDAGVFQSLVLIAPLAETLFYRGVLQERRGLIASAIGAGIGTLLLYWPVGAAANALGSVIGISVFLTLLAGLYSYIRQRFGLAASLACQVTLSFFLFFLPRLVVAVKP